MNPGHGDVLLAEGDPELAEDEERLVEEFRRQLDLGMWAAVPPEGAGGRHEATMVRDFSEVPRDAEQVIFFPRRARRLAVAAARRCVALALAAGRDRPRAERARAPSCSRSGCCGEEAPSRMYTELGFLALEGGGERLRLPDLSRTGRSSPSTRDSGELLNEYCVAFPTHEPRRQRLPDADDVLAKWMALRADERALIGDANMHLPGRQLDPAMVRRDLAWLRGMGAARHRRGIPGGEAEQMPMTAAADGRAPQRSSSTAPSAPPPAPT